MNFWQNTGKKQSGFTLIELLVVIAIIGILAAIALQRFSEARAKARDGAIKSQLTHFRTLMGLEFSENGSYANIQPDAWMPDMPCAGAFSGNYASQAEEICENLSDLAGRWTDTGSNEWGGPFSFYVGNITSNADTYSMMVPMNSKEAFYCMGASGASDTEDPSDFLFQAQGCYDNP